MAYRIKAIPMTFSHLQGDSPLKAFQMWFFSKAVQHLTKFRLTLCVAQSLCDSWASCLTGTSCSSADVAISWLYQLTACNRMPANIQQATSHGHNCYSIASVVIIALAYRISNDTSGIRIRNTTAVIVWLLTAVTLLWHNRHDQTLFSIPDCSVSMVSRKR